MAPLSDTDPSPADQAITAVCARHLHHSIFIPESGWHGALRVTFSTTSNFDDKTLPVALCCPPMFGSRWMALEFEHLAATHGVRVICPDR